MSARVRLQTFVLLADAFAVSEPYDLGGAFSLLQDIEDALGCDAPRTIAVAIRAHLAAALSRKNHACALARSALVRVTGEMERRLAAKTA